MVTYTYSRNQIANGVYINNWDIPNPMRIDGSLDQIQLATEIKAVILTKTLDVPAVSCDGTTCNINFTEALTEAEETILTNTVNTHKNNT